MTESVQQPFHPLIDNGLRTLGRNLSARPPQPAFLIIAGGFAAAVDGSLNRVLAPNLVFFVFADARRQKRTPSPRMPGEHPSRLLNP